MTIYNAAPIDESSLSCLKIAVQKYERLLENQFTFQEKREAHHILTERLNCVIDSRNKNIYEAIPDEDFEKDRSSGYEVMIDSNVEKLLKKALKLSYQYIINLMGK